MGETVSIVRLPLYDLDAGVRLRTLIFLTLVSWNNADKVFDTCPWRFSVPVFHCFLVDSLYGAENTIVNPICVCCQCFCFVFMSCKAWKCFIVVSELQMPHSIWVALLVSTWVLVRFSGTATHFCCLSCTAVLVLLHCLAMAIQYLLYSLWYHFVSS